MTSPLRLPSAGCEREIPRLDTTSFPTVEDVCVTLRDCVSLGFHLDFASASRGLLAGFPWWDHVERRLPGMTPLELVGSASAPHVDMDQGWCIVIWKDRASRMPRVRGSSRCVCRGFAA